MKEALVLMLNYKRLDKSQRKEYLRNLLELIKYYEDRADMLHFVIREIVKSENGKRL